MSRKHDPDLSDFRGSDFEHVYEPAEDSFLLMDAITGDGQFLSTRMPHVPVCVEIGIGSGAVSTCLSSFLKSLGKMPMQIATDINPHAAQLARRMFAKHHVTCDVVLCDLFSALNNRLAGKVDVLLFNPPYVPSPPEELIGDGISVSWAGGVKGREVLDRLLPHISDILAANGVFYLVVIQHNEPDEIARILAVQGFSCKMVAERKAGVEFLQILRFWRDELPAPPAAAAQSVDLLNNAP